MSEKRLEVCYCECHTNPYIHHMMPCCDECPWCKERIVIVWYEIHEKSCSIRVAFDFYLTGHVSLTEQGITRPAFSASHLIGQKVVYLSHTQHTNGSSVL